MLIANDELVTVWPVGKVESVTWMVNAYGVLLAVVGVPLITPLVVLRLRPGGSEPLARENVNGRTPPVVEIDVLYG